MNEIKSLKLHKSHKIVCFIVCFVIVLSMLTVSAFAVDASTGPTDTNTYLIKAGTYRFNDTLTYTTDINIDLTNFNFYTPRSIAFDEANGTVSLVNNPSYFTNFKAFYSTVFVPNTLVIGYAGDLLVYNDAVGWDASYELLADPSVGLDVDENVKGYGQTIVVPEDTYVPQDVGIWLNSNWNVIPDYEGNPWVDILNGVATALDVNIFGTFSYLDIVSTLAGACLAIWLLKMLAGG